MPGSAIARRRSSSARNHIFGGVTVHCAAFTFVRNLCLIGTLACAASPAAAARTAAAKPTPDLTIKNKAVEASVFLDAAIKADPALTFDCLTEGKKWIDKNAAEAEDSRKQDSSR